MNITLTPELERLVREKIETGYYNSVTELIRVALLLLDEREELERIKIESLKKEIAIGSEQLKNGNYSEYDEESLFSLINEIETEGRKKLENNSIQ